MMLVSVKECEKKRMPEEDNIHSLELRFQSFEWRVLVNMEVLYVHTSGNFPAGNIKVVVLCAPAIYLPVTLTPL
jgi:hypothetical protein